MTDTDRERALRAAGLPTAPVVHTPNQERLDALSKVTHPYAHDRISSVPYAWSSTSKSASRRDTSEQPAEQQVTSSRVRDWARSNGHKVGDKGPIPESIRDAYRTANGV